MIEPKDHILLAYSGGPDSTCLLSLLVRLQSKIPFQLSLAHLNHGLRPSAKKDETFVIQVAKKYALPLVLKRVDVRAYARKRRLNLEEAGRELRYHFLEETRKRLGATKIATGHNLDDQAETFLLRLIRGSGPRGLRGILPEIEGKIIRPLIFFRRREIETYLKELKIPFCLDESNFDRRFLRNRLRLELIPLLEERFNPQIVANLARMADILREEEDFLEKIEEEQLSRVIKVEGNDLWLDAKALEKLHPALARRLIRRFLMRLRGDLREISFQEVEAVRRLEPGKKIHLKRGIKLVRLNHFILEEKSWRQLRNYQLNWDGKQTIEIPGLGFKFSGQKIKGDELPPFDDGCRACLSWRKLDFPLLIRTRRPGDRYQPLGSDKPKKLKAVMSSRHIPVNLRPFWPLFISGKEIVWIPGCPINEAFKIQSKKEAIFVIEKL
ncbi:MAG: tRNA lysidine(34) synthetase TilS [Candidatus Aminicenantes bacterium]|nr:tRNA lysidine(34) synthetase TilS [Candidatus Aminicenantes bacterium]